MPELPEVEVTRRGLSQHLIGARVQALRLGKPLRWPMGCAPDALVGAVVSPPVRRGKYIWLGLTGGAQGQGGLLLHLGMSGSLQVLAQPGAPGPHDHVDLVTDRGTMRLTDPRRFGAVVWSAGLDVLPASKLLARLGLEPFDAAWSGAHLHAASRGRRVAIKPLLLSGEVVVGAGNIYACEALFRAGIDPRLAAHRLSKPRCDKLAEEIRAVLAEAIEAGGSSLKDFKATDGAQGHFQLMTQVYGREGEPCKRCGGAIRKILQGQRATYFCPACQRR
jgi:formamidopyrimidine-DNA glycosylase